MICYAMRAVSVSEPGGTNRLQEPLTSRILFGRSSDNPTSPVHIRTSQTGEVNGTKSSQVSSQVTAQLRRLWQAVKADQLPVSRRKELDTPDPTTTTATRFARLATKQLYKRVSTVTGYTRRL